MARKKAVYKVEDEGRDKGKIFILTEMSAHKAEQWAMRTLLALIGSNVQLPDNVAELGAAGLAELGFKALSGLKWDLAEPLLKEMMECVEIQPDPRRAEIVRPLIEEDIEEIPTRFKLRIEVWKLHMGFLSAVTPYIFGNERAANPSASTTQVIAT